MGNWACNQNIHRATRINTRVVLNKDSLLSCLLHVGHQRPWSHLDFNPWVGVPPYTRHAARGGPSMPRVRNPRNHCCDTPQAWNCPCMIHKGLRLDRIHLDYHMAWLSSMVFRHEGQQESKWAGEYKACTKYEANSPLQSNFFSLISSECVSRIPTRLFFLLKFAEVSDSFDCFFPTNVRGCTHWSHYCCSGPLSHMPNRLTYSKTAAIFDLFNLAPQKKFYLLPRNHPSNLFGQCNIINL